MSVGAGIRRLTRVLRDLERDGWLIQDMYPADGESLRDGDRLALTLTCTRDRRSGSSALPELAARSESSELRTVELQPTEDGRETATIRVAVPLVAEHQGETAVSENPDPKPLHRDQARLRELYHQHESFSAMARAVDADVSGETIRRYMIEHGIHYPGQSNADRHPEAVRTDGRGVPMDIEGDVLVDVLERANTPYDVQRQLDLGREETVALLERLDVLEFVVGRVDTEDDRRVRRETIERRVRGFDHHDASRNR